MRTGKLKEWKDRRLEDRGKRKTMELKKIMDKIHRENGIVGRTEMVGGVKDYGGQREWKEWNVRKGQGG